MFSLNNFEMENQQEILRRLINIEALLVSQKSVFTFDEAVSFTGLKKSYLYKLTSRGDIPHFKPNGKNIYFEKEGLEQWLLRNRVKTNAEIESEASSFIVKNPK